MVKPSEIEGFILSEYGIYTDVILYNGSPVIKTYNHLSLFSIITKIRRHFDFIIEHKKETNEFIILIGKMHEV